eukprot:4661738-Amphidinium_carterae.1
MAKLSFQAETQYNYVIGSDNADHCGEGKENSKTTTTGHTVAQWSSCFMFAAHPGGCDRGKRGANDGSC